MGLLIRRAGTPNKLAVIDFRSGLPHFRCPTTIVIMANCLIDEQAIHSALEDVFEGSNSRLRKRQRVLEHIAKQQSSEVRELIYQHGIDAINDVAVDFLKNDVFTSTATLTSPPRFNVNRGEVQHHRLGPDPAFIQARTLDREQLKDHDTACHNTPHPGLGTGAGVSDSSIQPECVASCSKQPDVSSRPSKRQRRCTSASLASLSIPHLPMRIQHRLLTRTQQLMEHACYNFFRATVSKLLQERGWDCPNSVELNKWAQLLKSYERKIIPERLVALDRPVSEVLDSMAQLRHTAVHRVRAPVMQVKHFLDEAETVGHLLGGAECDPSLARLHETAQPILHDFHRAIRLLASSLEAERAEIASTRLQLDDRKASIAVNASRKINEQKAAAGLALEGIIDSLNWFLHTTIGAIIVHNLCILTHFSNREHSHQPLWYRTIGRSKVLLAHGEHFRMWR